MAPSNFVPTVVEGAQKYASECSSILVIYCRRVCKSELTRTHGSLFSLRCNIPGVWQERDETGNPLQKLDVELVKDEKRFVFVCCIHYTCVCIW